MKYLFRILMVLYFVFLAYLINSCSKTHGYTYETTKIIDKVKTHDEQGYPEYHLILDTKSGEQDYNVSAKYFLNCKIGDNYVLSEFIGKISGLQFIAFIAFTVLLIFIYWGFEWD